MNFRLAWVSLPAQNGATGTGPQNANTNKKQRYFVNGAGSGPLPSPPGSLFPRGPVRHLRFVPHTRAAFVDVIATIRPKHLALTRFSRSKAPVLQRMAKEGGITLETCLEEQLDMEFPGMFSPDGEVDYFVKVLL